MINNIQRIIILRALQIRASQGENPAVILECYTSLRDFEKTEILDQLQRVCKQS